MLLVVIASCSALMRMLACRRCCHYDSSDLQRTSQQQSSQIVSWGAAASCWGSWPPFCSEFGLLGRAKHFLASNQAFFHLHTQSIFLLRRFAARLVVLALSLPGSYFDPWLIVAWPEFGRWRFCADQLIPSKVTYCQLDQQCCKSHHICRPLGWHRSFTSLLFEHLVVVAAAVEEVLLPLLLQQQHLRNSQQLTTIITTAAASNPHRWRLMMLDGRCAPSSLQWRSEDSCRAGSGGRPCGIVWAREAPAWPWAWAGLRRHHTLLQLRL